MAQVAPGGSGSTDAWADDEGSGSSSSDSENECHHLRNQVYEYADATTIHGVKYTLEKGRAIIERCVYSHFYKCQGN